MNRQMLCLLALLLSAPLAVSAQTADQAADPNAPMQVTASEEDASLAQDEKPKASDRYCLRHTGSLITARRAADSRRCAGIGRVYTQEDLRRTGHIDVGDALRMLDPAIY